MVYTKNDIIMDLQVLGLKKGDICVVRSALKEIGPIVDKRSTIILDALLDVVGPQGTIVTLTFTKHYPLPIDPINSQEIFTPNSEPYSGGLPKECLSRPESKRSKHPVTSFCAIGKNSDFILQNHDEKESCYEPIGKIIEKNGKMLLIGAVNSVPGFTTVHWAQWLLGYSKQSKHKGKYGAYYYDEGGYKKLYIRNDFGGCSKGYGKFYKYYDKAGILNRGRIGNAESLLIGLKSALAIEIPLMKASPRFSLCDDPYCQSCRTSWEFSDTSLLQLKLREKIRNITQRIKKQ